MYGKRSQPAVPPSQPPPAAKPWRFGASQSHGLTHYPSQALISVVPRATPELRQPPKAEAQLKTVSYNCWDTGAAQSSGRTREPGDRLHRRATCDRVSVRPCSPGPDRRSQRTFTRKTPQRLQRSRRPATAALGNGTSSATGVQSPHSCCTPASDFILDPYFFNIIEYNLFYMVYTNYITMLYRANHEIHDKNRERNGVDLCTAEPPVFSPLSDLPRHP